MNNNLPPNLNIDELGIINPSEVFYNISYEDIFQHETSPSLEGFERAVVTEFGAVNVDTGKFTGRSPKDKYFVEDDLSNDTIWWAEDSKSGSDNKKINQATWDHLKGIVLDEYTGHRVYVMDGFAGANPETRLSVRIITEVAWQAHFFKNMFIRPSEAELVDFKPGWTILNGCKTRCADYEQYNLHSDVFVAFNISERQTLIGGTWYGGEIKKGIFSMMNYFLPLREIGAFHCSANMGRDGDTALFFGLSGTGKTTLSTDPKRALIGDDEHGWDEDGIFNFEGGCYAKCINLSQENEPEIYGAIKRDALLENLDVNDSGVVDFLSTQKTENTRVSYPLYHIENIVKPVSKGGHPKTIIFLTCDAYGVLPPVARLTKEQAMYHYLSGYTAKVAGTERGVTEPQATFSACFGQAFLTLHPTRYADILGKKMQQHHARAYLVNTGWTGGPYGEGMRMSLPATRKIIDAILNGSIEESEYERMSVFNLDIPRQVEGVDVELLNPRNSWSNKDAYDDTARKLAERFIQSFEQYTDTPEGQMLVAAGPQI